MIGEDVFADAVIPGYDLLFGGAGDDRLADGSGGGTLYGGAGEDALYGDTDAWRAGRVVLFGGDGNDRLTGDLNGTMSGDAGDDVIEGAARKFYGGDGDDTMSSSSRDGVRLNGGDGNDAIGPIIAYDASAAADLLKGEDGDDTLYLYGADRGYGGSGSDQFVFTGDDGEARKRILDFEPLVDSLRFRAEGLVVSNVLIETVDRPPGRPDDVRVRIEIDGGRIAQDVLCIGVDDMAGIAVQLV